jgi:nucleotide-binding universal stress UspA family protein
MIRRVVFGTDQGPEAAGAMRWAADFARSASADLTVVEAFAQQEAERSPDRLRAIERARVGSLRTWVQGIDDGPWTIRATEGEPGPALVDAAARQAADVVAIGSKAYEGATHLGLGSLAHWLALHLACPLLVLPARGGPVAGGWLVVGHHDSPGSSLALDWARDLADQVGAQVCAVRSRDDRIGHDGPRAGHPVALDGVDYVERIERDPAALLRRVGEERDGVIVVAARRRPGVVGRPLGAVPDALLHHPTRPVALIPHGWADDVAPADAQPEVTAGSTTS